jgi:predicted transcriptional regulator
VDALKTLFGLEPLAAEVYSQIYHLDQVDSDNLLKIPAIKGSRTSADQILQKLCKSGLLGAPVSISKPDREGARKKFPVRPPLEQVRRRYEDLNGALSRSVETFLTTYKERKREEAPYIKFGNIGQRLVLSSELEAVSSELISQASEKVYALLSSGAFVRQLLDKKELARILANKVAYEVDVRAILNEHPSNRDLVKSLVEKKVRVRYMIHWRAKQSWQPFRFILADDEALFTASPEPPGKIRPWAFVVKKDFARLLAGFFEHLWSTEMTKSVEL